ncbi:cyclic nucleotide gated channel 1 [Prunus dulcis]|uniref:Cyclic nucleotide gated channel 1 n=1 Tax=Prunus dulcis TaxID=3755 RepID=A0A4Y1RLG2_PRUDU|nr:cyclic nucleotide gated channel 1 [Prunus dulcis]
MFKPARFCFWELTKQLPRVVTHPGIAPASNSLNFGVPTNPKPVSSQKASLRNCNAVSANTRTNRCSL